MNTEYLLDAIGLLDDELIREAETCTLPRRRLNYSRWMTLAASFAVVIALGWLLRNGIGMGGGSAAPGNTASGAAGEPSSSAGMEASPPESMEGPDGSAPQGGGDWAEPGSPNGSGSSDNAMSQEPGANGEGSLTGDWLPAIRVDGVVYYWDTREYIHLEPEEDDIRYTTSFINSWEPEEDGQANFLPIGLPYVVLDNGTVAVLHNEETNTWKVYDSVPPWEK